MEQGLEVWSVNVLAIIHLVLLPVFIANKVALGASDSGSPYGAQKERSRYC